jgi:hypothetical protein
MRDLFDPIVTAGRQRGEPPPVALRHHLIEAVLRRVARLPDQAGFVLRGGILTRFWVAPLPRPTRDLDFLGDFPYSVGDTRARFASVLHQRGEDAVIFDPERCSCQGIWQHTDFPGVRITLALGLGLADQELTLDVGFGDPLVPPAASIDYQPLVGDAFPLRACRPETQVGWKLHGLAEMGSEWRPKDLADLWRITQRVPLDAADLPAAIEVAFVSRGFSIADAVKTLHADHWTTKTARVRWTSIKGGVPDLARTLAEVRQALAPALDALDSRTSRI